MRQLKYVSATLAMTFLSALLYGVNPVLATDGNPVMDLGIFSWIKYQKKQFFTDIIEVKIKDNKFQATDHLVSIYQPIIFENLDDANHRLVFHPGLENLMDFPYTSPVIKPGERWGLELHTFGVFPYQCTLHPEEHGEFTVKL